MRSSFTILSIILVAVLIPTACRTDYFLHPLPVDRRDRTCIPASLRGKYIAEIESAHDTLLFLKKSLVYLRPSDTLSYSAPYTLRYDTITMKTDTIFRYRIFGDLLFTMDAEAPFLVNHWPYVIDGDTVRAIRHDSVIIDLGMNCFFRKVKRHTYILNYKTDPTRDEASFWYPFLFRWNKKGIELFPLLPETADSMNLHFYQQSNTYYYNLRWTARQIDSMIRKNVLVPESVLTRIH